MTKDKFRILWLKRQHVETKRKNWIWFENEKKNKKESTGVGHAGLPRNVRGFTMNNKKENSLDSGEHASNLSFNSRKIQTQN